MAGQSHSFSAIEFTGCINIHLEVWVQSITKLPLHGVTSFGPMAAASRVVGAAIPQVVRRWFGVRPAAHFLTPIGPRGQCVQRRGLKTRLHSATRDNAHALCRGSTGPHGHWFGVRCSLLMKEAAAKGLALNSKKSKSCSCLQPCYHIMPSMNMQKGHAGTLCSEPALG
eukprot:s3524_g12.t1